MFFDNQEKPKLLNTFSLTLESNSTQLEELFDLIKFYVRSQNYEKTIQSIFNLLN